MGVAEDYLKRQKGLAAREAAMEDSTDPGYIGGFVGSAFSGLGEMFGMEPSINAERFRRNYPISGVVSEFSGALMPYIGWEGAIARSPRLAASLGGAAEKIGISAINNPIAHGAANLAIRYAPVELSRLGAGYFLTEDWDKYQGLMSDVGLSTLLTGGFGGLGGFLRSGGPIKKLAQGRVAQAPTGLMETFEYRLSKSPSATTLGNVPMENVQQNLFREIFTQRPLIRRAGEGGERFSKPVRGTAVSPLEGQAGPAGVNILFNEGKNAKGLMRQKLMQNDGTWTFGDDGNKEILGGLGFKNMETLAENAVYPTVVDVGSGRAAGHLKAAMKGLSPVGDGAVMGREAGDGLFVVGLRLRPGEAPYTPKAGLHRFLKQPGAVKTGDRWFFTKTDKPQLFVRDVGKSAELTFSQFAKYREAFRPEVNTSTLFNQIQNRVLQTFTPEDMANIRRGMPKEQIRSSWLKRMTSSGAGFIDEHNIAGMKGLKDSEQLRGLWDEAYNVIAPSMFKGVRNSVYDRLFSMLRLNKETAETMVNKMIGGEVFAKSRRGLGKWHHNPEVAPGVKTLNSLIDDNRKFLTENDYRMIYAVGNAQAPKEKLAELTADGLISPQARAVLDGIEKLDKYFWQQMLPVAEGLGLSGKFSLLQGPFIPKIMKGDWYVPVTDASGKQLKYIASGTRNQAIKEADAWVKAAKEKGVNVTAQNPRSWYQAEGQAKDDLLKLHKQMEMAAMQSPQIADITSAAMRNLAVEGQAGLRSGLVRGPMPKSLSAERSGVAGSTGGEFTAKELISDLQQHYNMIGRYLGYQSWYQRWLPEAQKLHEIDPKMARDLGERARMMQGYEGKQARYLNNVLSGFLGPSMGGKAATKIAQEANSLMYHWNIGIANPVFALVNLLTPLQTVAPWIAMMKTAPQAADDLMHTHFSFGSSGKVKGLWNTLDIPKLMMKSLRELGNPGDDLLEHLGRAKTDGSLSPQLFENSAGHGSKVAVGIRDSYNRAGGGVPGFWDAAKNIATWASRNSEEWSREYAFTAGHVVGRDLLGLKGEALYRFAQRATHVTQYGYHAMDRSMMFTGPLGSTFGLFKNWQMHFIGSMMEYAGLGWREGNWAPLIWQFAGSLAVGGLGATPLVMVADQITDWMENEPNSYLAMKKNFPQMADEVYYGFPALFGASLQASSALPGTDVTNDLTMLSNFVFLERAKAAWKATATAYEYSEQTGQNPLKNPNIRDALLQGYAPRALWRLFSTTEGDAIKSMSSGYPQVRDVSGLAQLAYSVGLNPVEIEAQQDAARYMHRDQESQRSAISMFGRRFAAARQARDEDEMTRTVLEAQALGLPLTSISRSAQSRTRRENRHDLLTKYGGEGFLGRQVLEDDE